MMTTNTFTQEKFSEPVNNWPIINWLFTSGSGKYINMHCFKDCDVEITQKVHERSSSEESARLSSRFNQVSENLVGAVSVMVMTLDSLSDNLGSIPGRSPANRTVHPSEVDKLGAISKQWVTAIEYCECKCAWPYDGCMQGYAAGGAIYLHMVSCGQRVVLAIA
jgi:hypothetical protein